MLFVSFAVKNPFLLGVLCVFARDIPNFGCGVAALSPLWSKFSLDQYFVGFVDFLESDFDIAAGL